MIFTITLHWTPLTLWLQPSWSSPPTAPQFLISSGQPLGSSTRQGDRVPGAGKAIAPAKKKREGRKDGRKEEMGEKMNNFRNNFILY